MFKSTESLETIKSIILDAGYTEAQVNTVLKYMNTSNLLVEIKDDSLFDIVNKETNECIDTNASVEIVVERGFDCLRNIIENNLRNNANVNLVNTLLDELNSMFENPQYVIKELDGLKYLALNI